MKPGNKPPVTRRVDEGGPLWSMVYEWRFRQTDHRPASWRVEQPSGHRPGTAPRWAGRRPGAGLRTLPPPPRTISGVYSAEIVDDPEMQEAMRLADEFESRAGAAACAFSWPRWARTVTTAAPRWSPPASPTSASTWTSVRCSRPAGGGRQAIENKRRARTGHQQPRGGTQNPGAREVIRNCARPGNRPDILVVAGGDPLRTI